MKLCLDASIVVKWFKKGERFEAEANKLLEKISSFKIEAVANEFLILEIVRALTKHKVELKFTNEDVANASKAIKELMLLGAIKNVNLNKVLYFSEIIIRELSLPVIDSVHLATAISECCDVLITDDEAHLLKAKVKNYCSKFKLKILRLDEL